MKKILLFALFSSFWACQREIETLPALGYEYAPLQTGKFIQYRVDSILYDDYNNSIDTNSYEVKYVLGREEIDAAGLSFFRYERYERADSSQDWTLINVSAIQIEANRLLHVEQNQRLIKLTFPIAKDKNWDGLAYIRKDTTIEIVGGSINFYKDWENFEYTTAHTPFNINGFSFDSTVTISQADANNLIERRFSKEIYAKNIGLVYKEQWILDTQCGGNLAACINTPWERKAEKGFILRQRITAHNF